MHAMRLQKSSTTMEPPRLRQRWRPAGALRAALLLLCLTLLPMRASTVSSALARPVPSENDNMFSLVLPMQPGEGDIRSEEVVPMEQSPQPDSEATEDGLKPCGSLQAAPTEPCVESFDRRFLDADYGSPGRNRDTHPAGPLP